MLRDGASFLIGKWLVEPTLNRLALGGTSIQLEHKAMDVLICLVEHAGEVVSKNDLLDSVWQTEFVSDNTLQGRIAEIRDALGDNAQNPTFIETIRKRGYRLIAEIGIPDLDHPVSDLPESPTQPDDERNPYPGLAAFTEADADVFFGREKEIAALWRKITSRRLLAVIGPSGIGKSSLLRAGVVTRAPPGWRVVVFTPGEDPHLSLARALAPDHAGDPSAVSRLVGFGDPDTALAVVSRWRGQFDEVVIVVDQFEELFTLNQPEVQSKFIELLRRLVDAADVHVVLALRDDFLFQCEAFPEIAPVFDGLTPLGAPKAEALRRAITEPAARLMHRFENETLVDRMVAEVEDQRGALPLLAFAVRRLWGKRDREERILTEEAYEAIGGVAGALARHAEAVMGEIGPERLPVVREIFRNLVTAEGTRAVREIDEVLSVFNDGGGEGVNSSSSKAPHRTVGEGFIPSRDAAREVLQKLIDARLLTTFETHDDEELPTRRVEIVHESLFANWPRLVRWQTQDADAAQLRNQLRQAARTWMEHDRSDDLLWAGSATREFTLWRERYPGGLTDTEEAFADAMTSHAGRRRRRRLLILAVVMTALVAGLAIVGSLWQRSTSEAHRAEGANLVSLGQLQLESYPSATVAHAIASLELADSDSARALAQAALWRGPTALVANDHHSWWVRFTPNGDRMIQSTVGPPAPLHIIDRNGGDSTLDPPPDWPRVLFFVNPTGTVLFTHNWATAQAEQHLVLWSIPDGRRLAEVRYEAPAFVSGFGWKEQGIVLSVVENDRGHIDAVSFEGSVKRLASPNLDFDLRQWYRQTAIDTETGRRFSVVHDGDVMIFEIGNAGLSEPRFLGRQKGPNPRSRFAAGGSRLFTTNADGEIRIWDPFGSAQTTVINGPPGIDGLALTGNGSVVEGTTVEQDRLVSWVWSLEEENAELLRRIDLGPVGMGYYYIDPSGSRVARAGPDKSVRLWSLDAPFDAEPVSLLRGDVGTQWSPAFHPSGDLLATADEAGVSIWPLSRKYPAVIRRHNETVVSVVFEPDGRWLASGGTDGTVWRWPLGGPAPAEGEMVFHEAPDIGGMALSPDSKHILVGRRLGQAVVVPLDGAPATTLDGALQSGGVAFSADGKLAAVLGNLPGSIAAGVTFVYQMDSWDDPVVIKNENGNFLGWPQFQSDGRILACGPIEGLWRLDPTDGRFELLYEKGVGGFSLSRDDRLIALIETSGLSASASGHVVLFDLADRTARPLKTHGDRVSAIALDPTGSWLVTGDKEGIIRVGPVSDGAPHLLNGHEGRVISVAIDPLGRWIASGGEDGTVRLWPMPDLTKPPLHTLPREELIAKLKTLTNLRVVRDPESSTGWKLTHDPFPGWETVPTW